MGLCGWFGCASAAAGGLATWMPRGLPALLGCAVLWLGWSLLVGSIANHLPDRLLEGSGSGSSSTPDARTPRQALRRMDQRLGVRHWKPWIPDAGNALPGGVSKASLVRREPLALRRLLLETRRAELVHWALWPAWLLTALWLPPAGVLINLVFATLFNLPCLLLQRYNRLRLELVLQRIPGGR
jgi:glycosyl-4,4'-diaponeurosporenoate acyltransferase